MDAPGLRIQSIVIVLELRDKLLEIRWIQLVSPDHSRAAIHDHESDDEVTREALQDGVDVHERFFEDAF